MGEGRRNYYEVSLTLKDIIYFFLCRKKCLKCNGKLKRVYKTEYAGIGKRNNSSILNTTYKEYDLNEVQILYQCIVCDSVFPISNLSTSMRRK